MSEVLHRLTFKFNLELRGNCMVPTVISLPVIAELWDA
jgi:hypothetical protein